jgi:hypothetical protein
MPFLQDYFSHDQSLFHRLSHTWHFDTRGDQLNVWYSKRGSGLLSAGTSLIGLLHDGCQRFIRAIWRESVMRKALGL